MAELNTFECDVCHAQHTKEDGQWWVIYRHAATSPDPKAITITPFEQVSKHDREHTATKLRDACGVECALKLAAQEMQGVIA